MRVRLSYLVDLSSRFQKDQLLDSAASVGEF